MFAKLINGDLKLLKMPIRIDGIDYITDDEEIIRRAGYKRFIDTPCPIDEKIYDYYFEETETEIYRKWKEIKP